jgi:predicted glycosyl hydrolase (DUF1957 family)
MRVKYFSLVLHSHIPYVLAHGSWPHGMDWLFEAAAEHFERARTLLEWIRRESPLSPDQMKLLETWEEEDQLFSEVVTPDGRII